MKVMREGVFETNSSSTHSICISDKQAVLDTLPIDENGVLNVYPDEFGWGVEDYNNAPMKAAYCLTWLKADGYENVCPRKNDEELFVKVLKDVTGAKTVRFIPASDGDFYPYGYIDHQSDGVCAEAFKDYDTLKNFIFNPESVLYIDNDNH